MKVIAECLKIQQEVFEGFPDSLNEPKLFSIKKIYSKTFCMSSLGSLPLNNFTASS